MAFLCYINLILLCLSAIATARDLKLGKLTGKKFFDQHLFAKPAFWKQVSKVEVKCRSYEVITRIEIRDLRSDKKGVVDIVAGGVGSNYAVLRLASPSKLRGYSFHVQAYAVLDE